MCGLWPKKIGNVNLDFSVYTGNDCYSDGSVEDELLAIVKQGKEKEALEKDNRWPVFYHLSPMRKNLLSWYPFENNAEVLEIGMGCGAVTASFADKVKSVDGVELSARRAQIAAWKNKDFSNVCIHVGNLNDMRFSKQFDYVTLIGVLEYAGSFTAGDKPYLSFIDKCKSFLKTNGTLIIAIENRLGMKYFSGAAEDHTGNRFDGIIGYSGITNVKTFSKPGLTKLLNKAGLSELEWYYPHPDYKIPMEIFSDYDNCELKLRYPMYSFDRDRIELFSEQLAFESVAADGLLGIFANSFLVFARKKD